MLNKTSSQDTERAKRFPLRLPVYFRELDSPTWLEGTTENISYTGMLFLSSSALALESTLDLKLRLGVGIKGGMPPEVLCKGVVVRQEQRRAQQASVALAIAIRDFSIVRHLSRGMSPVGDA